MDDRRNAAQCDTDHIQNVRSVLVGTVNNSFFKHQERKITFIKKNFAYKIISKLMPITIKTCIQQP